MAAPGVGCCSHGHLVRREDPGQLFRLVPTPLVKWPQPVIPVPRVAVASAGVADDHGRLRGPGVGAEPVEDAAIPVRVEQDGSAGRREPPQVIDLATRREGSARRSGRPVAHPLGTSSRAVTHLAQRPAGDRPVAGLLLDLA